jgi:hypothetical protein
VKISANLETKSTTNLLETLIDYCRPESSGTAVWWLSRSRVRCARLCCLSNLCRTHSILIIFMWLAITRMSCIMESHISSQLYISRVWLKDELGYEKEMRCANPTGLRLGE